MMEFIDHIEIDPRYPGRSQTSLLKAIRSSQYEHSASRSSLYRQFNGEVGKSISRKSRYQVGATPDSATAQHRPPNSPSATPPSSSSSRRSRYNNPADPDSSPHSHHRSSTHEQKLKHPAACLAPENIPIPTSPIPIQQHHHHIRLPPPSERSNSRRSKYSPSCSPDSKPLSISLPPVTPSPTSSNRERASSTYSQNRSAHEPTSPHEDSPEDLYDNDSSLMDPTKDDEDFVLSPAPTKPLTEVGDYIIKRDIGQGTFGVVKLGEHRVTKQKVAIKVITKASIKNSRAKARVEQELRLLPLLEHPHIVKVYDVIEDDERFMIIMEHLTGGELFQYIVKNRRVNEREARFFFRQILSALDYCHQNSIIHRDMKPENLLFDSKMQIRLIDFGFANFYQTDSTLSTFCGSPYYASPEMIRGVEYVGPEVDIWSLGVTLYTMLSGKLPFNAYNMKSFQRKVTRGEYEIPVYFSKEVNSLIRCMLNTDRRKRMTMEQVRLHAWTNAGYSDLPNSYLTIRPATVRNPDSEILKLMKPYGYDEDQTRAFLMANNRHVHPVFCLYHLLDTSRQRQAKELQKIEKIRQRTIKRNAMPPSVDTSERVLEALGLEDANTDHPSSPVASDHDDPDPESNFKGRRYSIDTMRDEDFEGEIPLAQTPLKAAGRSFDSISRRCSVQSKLRPVVMPSKLAKEDGDDDVISPRGELGNNGGHLLGKEPKDGWFLGLFNVSATSAKPYQQIVQELERVLINLKIAFQETENRFVCHNPVNKLAFEVRIQWKESVKAHVVQFKNLKGSSWAHKKYCYKIIQRMFI